MIELIDVRLDHPRDGEPLVSEANLKVTRGEVVLIVGAGTSRLAAAVLGEVCASTGRIEIMGRDVSKLRRASLRLIRRRIGIVPQQLCLLEERSAQINVALPLEIDGLPRSMTIVRANEMLARMELESEASLPVDCLSAAERQRVAVARGLVRKPEILIADHPTSLQDADGAELVCAAFADAAAAGAAVLVFGRDPTLRAIAESRQWRQLALVDARLRPLRAIEVTEEVVVDSAPVEDNIVPFPLSARTAGVA
jgi:cell division transport system ATP-binding protein